MQDKDSVKLYRAFYILGDSTSLKILFELERYGEKTFTELKDNLHINPATLSKKLKVLTQVGLIYPDKSHDHLRVFYTLHQHQKPLKRVLDSIERLAADL
jgi:DNA-binding HxlR family transcriptional regulator